MICENKYHEKNIIKPNAMLTLQEVEEKCFFEISIENLLHNNMTILDYECISKLDKTKNLGIKRRRHRCNSNKIVFDTASDIFKYGFKELNPEIFYANVNKDENEFFAFLLGTVPLINIVRDKVNDTIFDFWGVEIFETFRIESFNEFIKARFENYKIAISVLNGYDLNKSKGIGFYIYHFNKEDSLNHICLTYDRKVDYGFRYYDSFWIGLFRFLLDYYHLSTIPVPDNKTVKYILLDVCGKLYDEGFILNNEHTDRTGNIHMDIECFLNAKMPLNYSLIIDFVMQIKSIQFNSTKEWIKPSYHTGVNSVCAVVNKLKETVVDKDKREAYEAELRRKNTALK